MEFLPLDVDAVDRRFFVLVLNAIDFLLADPRLKFFDPGRALLARDSDRLVSFVLTSLFLSFFPGSALGLILSPELDTAAVFFPAASLTSSSPYEFDLLFFLSECIEPTWLFRWVGSEPPPSAWSS